MSDIEPPSEADRDGVSAAVYHHTPEEWERIKDDVYSVVRYAREERIIAYGDIDEWVNERITTHDPSAVRVLLKKDGKVIGFSLAKPALATSDEDPSHFVPGKTASIGTVVILPEYQGRGYVGKLMGTMEDELRRRGFEEMESWLRSDNQFADKIERQYGERIIDTSLTEPDLRYLKIKL